MCHSRGRKMGNRISFFPVSGGANNSAMIGTVEGGTGQKNAYPWRTWRSGVSEHASHHRLDHLASVAHPSMISHNPRRVSDPGRALRECRLRRWFLWLSLLFTIFGCLVAGGAIAMPAWQVLDLPELGAHHEHSILYDCERSEVTPLDRLHTRDITVSGPMRRCTAKLDPALIGQLRAAIEQGDFGARELLNHRFMPQHKAVVFFFVFTVLFAIISVLVGACSGCFVPNAVLHVVSIGLATSCSLISDIIFFVGATRADNRRIPGPFGQHLSYAFFLHSLGTLLLVLATLCSGLACYLMLLRHWQNRGWGRGRKAEELCRNVPKNGSRMEEGYVQDQMIGSKYLGEKWNHNYGALSGYSDPKNVFLAAGPGVRPDSTNSMDCLPPPPPTPQLYQNWSQLLLSTRHGSVNSTATTTRAGVGVTEPSCSASAIV